MYYKYKVKFVKIGNKTVVKKKREENLFKYYENVNKRRNHHFMGLEKNMCLFLTMLAGVLYNNKTINHNHYNTTIILLVFFFFSFYFQ